MLEHQQYAQWFVWLTLLFIIIFLSSSCTYLAPKSGQIKKAVDEASRVNNSAAAEALNTQPTDKRDAHTETARMFVEQNRRLLGEPSRPFPVMPLLQSNMEAQVSLKHEFGEQDKVISQQKKVQERLIDYGAKYEEQRNERISWWTKWLSFGGLGIGGIIALCVFVPAVIPILFKLLAWLIGKLPSVGSWLGVVSYDAYKRAVIGIQESKAYFEKTGQPDTLSVLKKIAKENTYPDAALVDHVKTKECYTQPK